MRARKLTPRRAVLGASMAVALAATAVPAAADASPVAESGPKPPAIQPRACANPEGETPIPADWRCGYLEVPLEYRAKGGYGDSAASDRTAGTVRLAIAYRPAGDPAARVGALFLNPGGPGGSGIDLARGGAWAEEVSPEVRERFDLVTWDPRGVGESTQLRCAADDEAREDLDELAAPYQAPRSTAELRGNLGAADQLAKSCHTHAGPLLSHVSTMENVHDLDRLRGAFHDPRLNYFGISYGTTIGAVYANVFPHKVRAMALHGVVDNPARFNDLQRYVATDAEESDRTMEAVLAACDRAGSAVCALAGGAEAKYRRLVEKFGSDDSGGAEAREAWLATVGNARALSGSFTASAASQAAANLQKLYAAAFPADGTTTFSMPRLAPTPRPGFLKPAYTHSGDDVLNATNCTDLPPAPRSDAGWTGVWGRARTASTLDGAMLTGAYTVCRSLRDRSPLPRWTGPWDRTRAKVLLLNETHDQATSLAWAERMREAMGSRAALVPIDGFGHGVGTACSRKVMEEHLLTTRLPASGTRCADGIRNPFLNTAKTFGLFGK
ncbi:alpha/beta fold hydrolase [Streptomyces sp. NA04227]|uniref:alpha/beta fold hydrolase n=1 Tax=Streptomyces sp. NA04227 TaxID=2742136 RepID=UPI0015900E7B|nr:alpha/beta fold hydrolase [Streptomyces sp. NA04227]QKW06536.1 alpha/beta fold hydrolase [Streptomyces sp. NA04227]